MKTLRHTNVVNLYGVCTKIESGLCIIITEFMDFGSILDYFKKHRYVDLNSKASFGFQVKL